jgi:ABC-2 type transport system ATP-binding protein
METDQPIIELNNLTRHYGKIEAVNGLSLKVRRGRCYGFFGRNGAGKTTTIKCLLNLLQPTAGAVRVFGLDPCTEEVAIKSRLSYVPGMTVNQTLEFFSSFRSHWNRDLEADLLKRFQLDPGHKAMDLSRGQKTQLALIVAVCPEPELLVLDEPTSGLDPIVRREFIQTVIGAYHANDPENRTVFVSTHLIAEFEGLIDEFTIIEKGRELLTMQTDRAKERFRKIRASFAQPPARLDLSGALTVRQSGGDLEILADGNSEQLLERLRAAGPEELRSESLSLEELFVASKALAGRTL